MSLINITKVLFRINRGRLWWYNFQRNDYVEFYPNPARKYTGVVDQVPNEGPGQATVCLRGTQDEFFFDPGNPSESVQAEAYVEGYLEVAADPIFIFLNRR